jgi:replicative DNA helicase
VVKPDRSPPWNVEAEQGLLGSILQDDSILGDLALFLSSEDFSCEAHRNIYRALCELDGRDEPTDAVNVVDLLARRHELQSAGGSGFIAALVDGVPHAANARWYAEIVRSQSIERRILRCRDGFEAPPGSHATE